MKKDTSRNSIIIIGLLVAVFVMSIGYSLLSQQLTITGTSGTGSASWDIKFTSISKNVALSSASGVTEVTEPSISGTSTTFNVAFDYPGAKIVYDLIVTNEGTINATYVDYAGINEANLAEPTQIQYSIVRLNPDDDTELNGTGDLLSSMTNKFRITIEWVSTEEDDTVPKETTSKISTLVLNYRQKT